MKKLKNILQSCLSYGFVLFACLSSLSAQSVRLDSFQDVQLLNVQNCSVVQVNASWNHQNRVKIEQLSKICYVAEIDIEDKVIGATIAKEWNIKIVPTIIVLQNGKEVKRFEPGISMRFDENTIIESIRKEVKQVLYQASCVKYSDQHKKDTRMVRRKLVKECQIIPSMELKLVKSIIKNVAEDKDNGQKERP